MLALLTVFFIVGALLVDWKRSRLNWFDYTVLRASLVYSRLWHRWQSNRPAPFPLDRACLVACNHTCSTDPMYILAACRHPIGFVVANEHFRLHPFCHFVLAGIHSVPVRRGGNDPIALRKILRVLERGRTICVFPEGGLSNVRFGSIGQPKPGIGYLALKARVPVYPVYVHGGPRTQKLLPTWLFPTRRAAKVFFGAAVNLDDLYDRPVTRQVVEEATRRIMTAIESLRPTGPRDRHAPAHESGGP